MARGRPQISREAQRAMLALGLILFLIIAFLLGQCVARVGTDRILPASGQDYGEIALLGDETMLLETGSTGSQIHKWATTGKGVHTFQVEDTDFQPGSAHVSPEGMVRIGRLVKLMDAHPGISLSIFVGGSELTEGPTQSLLEARAREIGKVLVSEGVLARSEASPVPLPTAKEAAVYISLSKTG